MPKTKGKPTACRKCGEPAEGGSGLCLTCLAKAATLVDKPAAARVTEQVKKRLEEGNTSGPMCPFCKADLDWENLAFIETEATIYVREKIYYCPQCRAFLGVSSWHTEG